MIKIQIPILPNRNKEWQILIAKIFQIMASGSRIGIDARKNDEINSDEKTVIHPPPPKRSLFSRL